jgi:hypothetical protein
MFPVAVCVCLVRMFVFTFGSQMQIGQATVRLHLEVPVVNGNSYKAELDFVVP